MACPSASIWLSRKEHRKVEEMKTEEIRPVCPKGKGQDEKHVVYIDYTIYMYANQFSA